MAVRAGAREKIPNRNRIPPPIKTGVSYAGLSHI